MSTTHRFTVNGTRVEVDCEDDLRVLWVLRDLLGITGPKYGCGLAICQSCTSHINGQVFNPCSVRVGDLRPGDHITTIEGLADTFDGADLHPVQQVWIDEDVAQCGFCQPGQIMTAVDLIERARAEGRDLTDADLDALRNVCRCGTYPRVRAAILKAAALMADLPPTRPGAAAAERGAAGSGPADHPAGTDGAVVAPPGRGREASPTSRGEAAPASSPRDTVVEQLAELADGVGRRLRR